MGEEVLIEGFRLAGGKTRRRVRGSDASHRPKAVANRISGSEPLLGGASCGDESRNGSSSRCCLVGRGDDAPLDARFQGAHMLFPLLFVDVAGQQGPAPDIGTFVLSVRTSGLLTQDTLKNPQQMATHRDEQPERDKCGSLS